MCPKCEPVHENIVIKHLVLIYVKIRRDMSALIMILVLERERCSALASKRQKNADK